MNVATNKASGHTHQGTLEFPVAACTDVEMLFTTGDEAVEASTKSALPIMLSSIFISPLKVTKKNFPYARHLNFFQKILHINGQAFIEECSAY
jgi:hypothetical protein